jgi:hypothetical protein
VRPFANVTLCGDTLRVTMGGEQQRFLTGT